MPLLTCYRTRKCDHISPVLQRLHWLPIHFRFHFKILLTWNALHDMAPAYISKLIYLCNPSRQLRSSHKTSSPFLGLPLPMATEPYECAPKLWNPLPADLRFGSSLDILQKRLLRLIYLKLLMRVLRLLMVLLSVLQHCTTWIKSHCWNKVWKISSSYMTLEVRHSFH